MRALAALIAAAALCAPASAGEPERPFLSPLFGDHMVLQRGRPVPVWGWAEPGTRVSVSVAGRAARAVAGADGRWAARLPSLRAGGPHELVVEARGRRAAASDVLVGDVWLCSGQSNMTMGIAAANDAAREIAAADQPNLRLFTVPQASRSMRQTGFAPPAEDAHGRWLVSSPKTIAAGGWAGFSAACYFFGRELRRELGVPVGLIHASWGGTPAEAWTSLEGLRALPEYAKAVATLEEAGRDPRGALERVNRELAAWWRANDPGSAAAPGWADADLDDSAWKTMSLPGNWERSGEPELASFDGVVWFRKELFLDPGLAGKTARLSLGPVDDEDATFVNGTEIGATAGWEAKRDYAVPAGLLRPGRNVIAVRVLDEGGDGGLHGAPGELSLRVDGGPALPLAGPWRYRIGRPLAQMAPPPQRWFDNPNFPTTLYNGMIAPLAPFALKGAAWYQGESNTDRPGEYRRLLPAMIADWRATWGQGDFPFVIQQLANIGDPPREPTESGWAELREAQALTAGRVPRTALSVAIDVGDPHDVHPKDKQTVGRRMALGALAAAYGRRVEASGPTLRSARREGRALRLRFAHARGLASRGGEPRGFAVAGPDGVFRWARARVEGDSVVVEAAEVARPVAARYAWANNPEANLYNAAGLPAVPFRVSVPD